MNAVITTKMPVALAEELRDRAAASDRTISATVRLAVQHYLENARSATEHDQTRDR